MIVLVIIENSADYFDPTELIYDIKACVGCCILCMLCVVTIHVQTYIDLINCHFHVNIFHSLDDKNKLGFDSRLAWKMLLTGL